MAIRPPRAETADEHFPLAGEARAFFQIEFGGSQRLADMAGDRPGGQRGTRRGKAAQGAAELDRPQFRVAGGRKTVEVEGIHRGVDGAQLRCRIAENQGQDDAPMVEVQAM